MTEALEVLLPLDALQAPATGPLYMKLRGLLEDAIRDGRLGLGDALPPERDLADYAGVSRVTVRKAVDAWGLKLCAKERKWHSDTVSAVHVPDGIDSAEIVKRAYHKYQTSLGVGLNKVAGKVFRIGHLGWLNEVMVCGALSAAEMALRDCGVKVAPGSGVGAALEHFRLAEPAAVAKAA